MEPPKDEIEKILSSKPRYLLIGPKVMVVKTEKGVEGIRIHMRFVNSPITMIWDTPIPRAKIDVKVGDLLSLYTELLVNAEPEPTSVQ